MRKHRYILLTTFFLLLTSLQLMAQTTDPCFDPNSDEYGLPYCEEKRAKGETNCGNGIDDDGDGLIDYYDGDCLNDPNNPNEYIVDNYDCQAPPVENQFGIEMAWQSAPQTSATFGMPMVADIDNDGTPEVISYNASNGNIFILNGADGSTKRSINSGLGALFSYPAVADVDNDGTGELFVVNEKGQLKAYNHDLSDFWGTTHTSSYTAFGRQLGLADFDGDGNAELYQVNEIRDAKTGNVIIAGSHGTSKYPSANNWETELNATPVAIDILPKSADCPDCDGLELVVGHIVYSVDISNGKLTERLNMNDAATKPADYPATGYFTKNAGFKNSDGIYSQSYSSTSVVDFNGDGYLDVVLGGTTGSSTLGPTTVFLWDIHNDVVKSFVITREANTIPNNILVNFRDLNGGSCDGGEQCTWYRGVGTLNIANIDDDPELEITFMSGSSLYALDNNFTLKWRNDKDFWESSSGFTGTAVFDFDGDGKSEIIYRDEINLYIVDGTTGAIVNDDYGLTTFCSSQTQADYPIVADVDGDGETEIIVSCGERANTFGSTTTATGTSREDGHIKVYKAAGDNYWVPAREVWNQFSYFNVNINDNLTIPKVQQPHHKGFGSSLNKFLNQSPRISYTGQLVFPAPQLDFLSDSVMVTPPACPEKEFTVRLFFENNGDAPVNQPIPVSFYSANPEVAHDDSKEPYLYTQEFSVPGGLQPGAYLDTTITVTGERGDFTLYVSLNDKGQYDENGQLIPNSSYYPLTKLNGPVRECDPAPTVVSKSVLAQPFSVLASTISDNNKCSDTVEDNGEVNVVQEDGTAFSASEYSFAWRNTATNEVVSTDAYVSSLPEGTYEVTVQNTLYNCSSIPDTVEVKLTEDWMEAETIDTETIKEVSSCKPGTADGEARVLINGVEPSTSAYDILWLDEESKAIVSVQAHAKALKALQYIVRVTSKVSGCTVEDRIDMTRQVPVIMKEPTASAVSNCKQPNGSINAQLISGAKSSYEYMLIQHSPKQDTTIANNNGSFTNLNVGIYELRAYNPATQCGKYTEGFFVEVKPSKDPALTVEVVQEQTACEPPYNGQLSATINNPEEYSFVWYRGYEDPANIVATSATTPDTLGTNITDTYIVIATNTKTNCNTFGQIQLPDNVQPAPTITYNITSHQTKCTPNGSVQVTASPAGENYVYHLLQGSNTVATNSTGLFTGLEAGPYVAVVENDYTNCISDPTPVFEIEDQVPPMGSVTFNPTPRTNCDPATPNGALEAVVSNDDVANYTFRWFAGVDTTNAVSPQPDPSASHYLTNIAAGDYVIKVTSKISGCSKLEYTSLTDESVYYQDDISVQVTNDQYYCHDDQKSGSLEATLIKSAKGPEPDPDDYTFYWYEGRITDLENGTATEITGENSYSIANLDSGWYSVKAERNDGFGCPTINVVEAKIKDMRDYPVANINIDIVEQTSCTSNNPNGGLIGNVDGNTDAYIFTWYQVIGGVDTPLEDNPDAVINGFEVSNIGEGTYALKVEHRETGCTGREQVYLRDNIIKGDEIKLILTPTDAINCTPPDGIAEVTEVQISEDGWNTYKTVAISDYNYQWYYGTDTSTPIDPAVNPTAATAKLENMEPGDYTVLATGKNTDCPSIPYTTTVKSSLQSALTFDFGFDVLTDCINPDGGLWVENVSGGSGDYSYQWYKGGTLDYPIDGENSYKLSGMRSDKYTILITDNATGCSVDSTYTLPADQNLTPVPPAKLSSMIHSTTCDPNAYNGELVAEVDPGVKDASYQYHADGDFFYYWFEGENPRYKTNGNFDDPHNYDVFRNDPPVPGENKSTISNLAPGFYTVVIVDAKDYIASGGTASFGCQSDARTFEVKAIAKSPAAVFTTQPDTWCDGANGSANITVGKRDSDGDTTPYNGYDIVSATKDGASFTINNKTASSSNEQTTFTLTGLEEGEYEFQIRDLQTTCDTLIKVGIDSQEKLPNLLYTDVRVNQHQTTCNPGNGEVEVFNPPSAEGQLSDYTFYWYENISSAPGTSPDHTGTVWSGLATGKYYVYAKNNTTGCISSYREVEVKLQVTETVVKRTTFQQNTYCDATSPNGEITVEAYEEDGNGNKSTPANGYTFTWYKGISNTPYSVTNGSLTSTISGLAPGDYRVEVMNNDLQCVEKVAYSTITFDPVLPKFTAASTTVQHVKTCTDEGSITINEIKENGAIITDFSNYSFEWYQGGKDQANLISGQQSNQISNLAADTYYVRVINMATGGCPSEDFLPVTVGDNSTPPLIYKKEIVKFITCTGVNEGAIEVAAGEAESSIPTGNYTFTWSYADGSALPGTEVISNTSTGSRISNLEAGEYRVIVRNNDTQCSEEAYYTVGTNVIKPILSISKKQDQTYCSGNGWAEVTGVMFGGKPEDLSGYTFEWYEGSLSNPISSGTYGLSADGRSADQLVAGTYLIKAIGPRCESFPIQVRIEDKTEPLVVLPDGLIEPVIACDPSNKPYGEIGIRVNNSNTFITRWYEGAAITQMQDSIPGLSNKLEAKNLIPGFYTVYVEDIVTGCSVTRTYEIEGIAVPITVFLSTTPYSSCIAPDGKIAANVNGGSGKYIFSWYVGSNTNTSPIKVTQSSMLDQLTDGLYTVVVHDQVEAECVAVNSEVVIEDGRGKELKISISQDFPVTNCDADNPNGQLSASVNGDISRYNFFWYKGRDVTKKPIALGPVASNLAPTTYTVIARDKLTGCISAEFFKTVEEKQPSVDMPGTTVNVLSHVTHCTKPNGSAQVVLDSTMMEPMADYEYVWTDKNDKVIYSSVRTNIITGLPTGTYQATVYNHQTACFAGSGKVTIKEEIYRPDFEIVTTPSVCMESNGMARLEFTEPIDIVDITWETPIGYGSGFSLINQPPGEYHVTITDANGCTVTKSATIGATLLAFNGVSPNGDGKNDKFLLSCIENFDAQWVRIYNRAGAMVYENTNYDNEMSYFEGYGNRGLYVGGDKLPDGTYFYIIDLKNGEKPVSGYLELTR